MTGKKKNPNPIAKKVTKPANANKNLNPKAIVKPMKKKK